MRYKDYKSVDEKWVKSIPAHWDMIRLKGIFQDRKERNNPIVTDFILSLTANQGVVPVAEKRMSVAISRKKISLYTMLRMLMTCSLTV